MISVSHVGCARRRYDLKASDYGAGQRYHDLWVARVGGRDPDLSVDVTDAQSFGPQLHTETRGSIYGPIGVAGSD